MQRLTDREDQSAVGAEDWEMVGEGGEELYRKGSFGCLVDFLLG